MLHAVSLAGQERAVAGVAGMFTLYDLGPDDRALVTHDNLRREMAGRLAGDLRERDLTWLDYSFPFDLSADGPDAALRRGGRGVSFREP